MTIKCPHARWQLFFMGLMVFLFLPQKTYSWGSANGQHQWMVRTAYGLLVANDPAFKNNGFPDVEEVVAREGYFRDEKNKETGPDTPGASKFSDHYYNPETKEGTAPEAVYAHFTELIKEKVEGENRFNLAKEAAWSGHFIADVNVPYHVVGMSDAKLREIFKEYENDVSPDPKNHAPLRDVPLEAKYAGDDTVLEKATKDYRQMILNYIEARDKDKTKTTEFFDPGIGTGPTQKDPVTLPGKLGFGIKMRPPL